MNTVRARLCQTHAATGSYGHKVMAAPVNFAVHAPQIQPMIPHHLSIPQHTPPRPSTAQLEPSGRTTAAPPGALATLMMPARAWRGSAAMLCTVAAVIGAAAPDVAATAAAASCTFCSSVGASSSVEFDFSAMPTTTFEVVDNATKMNYAISNPCVDADPEDECDPMPYGPAAQQLGGRTCITLGQLGANATVDPFGDGTAGFNLTLPGGANHPECPQGRTLKISFICDASAPQNAPPQSVTEAPGCTYTFLWKHPAACGQPKSGASCTSPTPPPPPPPGPCKTCLPTWKPTYDMARSTVLYACNSSGMHSVEEAISYGVVVYDWSNGKAIWDNAQPMTDEELLTKQAEMVLAADPGIAGEQPRVWVYRNTIKALNWYTSVREKLDDPAYAGWFVRFKDYQGPSSNMSYHVPACTYEKCSGFYHDQEQTPEYPHGDGSCAEECDCGKAPCGEYIFDHRNDTFSEWFIGEYMVSNETLYHEPQMINLGWLDDSMTLNGPTEEDKHFISDTGSTPQDMQEHVAAYRKNMAALADKVVPMGGWWWQLTESKGPGVHTLGPADASTCMSNLRDWCTPKPLPWNEAHFYLCQTEDAIANATQYTSEFLLTRGDYMWLGYGWMGCGPAMHPRPQEWDVDYGVPSGVCAETGDNTGVFRREWSKATIEWDCHSAKGSITMK